MEARFFDFWHESQVFVLLAWKPDFGFWHESQVFGIKAGFWCESQVFGFQKCKYRLRVASLLNGIASIDGMSLPCSFGCEYRWNVASSRIWVQVSTECRLLAFFSKIWFCGYRWNVASPRFLKFEVFSNLCFCFEIWVVDIN